MCSSVEVVEKGNNFIYFLFLTEMKRKQRGCDKCKR